MRIVHVVTYISDDGAYGGPVAVARNQAAALTARGHEVVVYAAAPIPRPLISEQDGYQVRLFPAKKPIRRLGFAGMHAPGLTRALKQELSHTDVLHIHLARDLVTLPVAQVARRWGIPYVVQTHGMIDPSARFLSKPVDLLVTRPVLRGAAAALSLTDQEDRDLDAVAPGTRRVRIKNGVPVRPQPPYEGRDPVVLFLARLHPRKRVLAFVEMACRVAPQVPDAQFLVFGPDEGDGAALEQAATASGLGDRLRWPGPARPEDVAQLMAAASVYVLPSVGEVFPMSLLEAMSAGTPAVVTESLGIATQCKTYDAAIVTDGSAGELSAGVLSVLRSPKRADELRSGSSRYLQCEVSIDGVVARLESIYADVM